jgi:drug/metabolite transporter (DMT)-like permease
VIIPIIIIPFLVDKRYSEDNDTRSSLITILVGSIICALIFSALILIKRKRPETRKAELPIIIALIWIFIFIPLAIGLPIFLNTIGDNEKFTSGNSQYYIAVIALLILISIGLFTIYLYNYYSKDERDDNRLKFVI